MKLDTSNSEVPQKSTKTPIHSKQTLRNLKLNRKKANIRKELDKLVSDITQLRWEGKCGMCGQHGTQAHHYFGRQAHGECRWAVDNLIWLCWPCHMIKVHRKGQGEEARDAIIEKIGQHRFDRLKATSNTIVKFSVPYLEEMKSALTLYRQSLMQGGTK